MDEIRKSRALIEQILLRANSISTTMVSVSERLHVLNEKMNREQKPPPEEAPPPGLLDLHGSLLSAIVGQLTDAATLCALEATCSAMRQTLEGYDWCALCRLHWGITQPDPLRVRRMDAALLHGYKKVDVVGDASVVWEQRQSGDPWKDIYRDRTYGWRIVLRMLRWLRMHNHPANVSGVSHRFQLYVALCYMDMCTCANDEEQRRQEIIQHGGIPSLLALLGATHPVFRTQAAGVLANLMLECPEAKEQVSAASYSGKRLADRLEPEASALTQQASRALVNMFVDPPVPQVFLYNRRCEVALPDLRSGPWCLQEYTLRGEAFTELEIVVAFGSAGTISGRGVEIIGGEPEEFALEGRVDAGARWELTKVFSNRHRVLYKGFSDLHGAYGIYFPVRVRDTSLSFYVSMEASPKVFRLFQRERQQQEGGDVGGVAAKAQAFRVCT